MGLGVTYHKLASYELVKVLCRGVGRDHKVVRDVQLCYDRYTLAHAHHLLFHDLSLIRGCRLYRVQLKQAEEDQAIHVL